MVSNDPWHYRILSEIIETSVSHPREVREIDRQTDILGRGIKKRLEKEKRDIKKRGRGKEGERQREMVEVLTVRGVECK